MYKNEFGINVLQHIYIYIYIYSDENKYEIVNNFFITKQIPLKICVLYLDPMGFSIHIRFYNNFPPKTCY